MNASSIKNFDVNESIQHNYYFFSYCVFISNFQFSQLNLQQKLRCVYVDGEEHFGKFWEIIRGINTVKSLVKVFRVWRNKDALKMECNKRNHNISIFRDSNLNRISNVLLNRTRSFFRTFVKTKKFSFRF